MLSHMVSTVHTFSIRQLGFYNSPSVASKAASRNISKSRDGLGYIACENGQVELNQNHVNHDYSLNYKYLR